MSDNLITFLKLLISFLITIGVNAFAIFGPNSLSTLYYILSNTFLIFALFTMFSKVKPKWFKKIKSFIPSFKTVNIAHDPISHCRDAGASLTETYEGGRNLMNYIKTFWEKFKGYIIALLGALVTIVELYGGIIGSLLGEHAFIQGVSVVAVIPFAATVIIALLSNSLTKEQAVAVKDLILTMTGKDIIIANTEIDKQIALKTKELATLDLEYSEILNTVSTLVSNGLAVTLNASEQVIYNRYLALKAAIEKSISELESQKEGGDTNEENV